MSIVLQGSTSGSITLQEPAIAGSTVLSLPATSGTLITTGSTGQVIPKAALPTGSVLQVVMGTTTSTVSVSSGSQTDTGLNATITPLFASSRILVLTSCRIFCQPGTVSTVLLYRSSTIIQSMQRYGLTDASTAGSGNQFVTAFLDSPSTTSATNYRITFNRSGGSGIVYAQLDSDPSTITLMEIAA